MDTKSSKYEMLFQEQSVWRSIFAMSVPALLTIVIMIFYNLADMFFIAQLGDSAKVASVSIISPVFSIIMALATMIGVGGSTVIANAFGAGHTEKAKNTASLCFYSAVALGFIVTLLLFAFQTPLLRLLGTKPDMWADSRAYLCVLSGGTILMLIPSSMGMLVRAEGAVKESMIGNLIGTVANILLDPMFILLFGWGVTGAAAATVIGNFLSSCYYIHFVKRRATVLSLDPKRALVMPKEIFPVIALGVPNAASTILSGFASTFSNNLLSLHGTDAIAAAAAAGKASMLISMVQMGICMGVQPLMAYNYGAWNLPRLKEVLQKTGLLTGCIGLGTMALCFIFRRFIISLFLKEATVAAMGVQYMLYVMAGAPFLGLVYISTNFLQATQKATSAIIVSLLRQGLLLIPLLYLMHMLFGFIGLAAAHTAADIGAAIIATLIFVLEYHRVRKELT
ncbi:MAG: MATE family efflux transporter [Oscillospiraceae bacterium]|nr:MATE family efflux transporter [Oscillospiraceae bacterium]